MIDVGANTGQFAVELRLAGYAGPIVTFEPVSDAFGQLSIASRSDPMWTVMNCALGEVNGTATINVAANSMSSSLLDMSEAHRIAAPNSDYVRREEVIVRRLDSVDLFQSCNRLFCKIDTQGFERQVLNGIGDMWSRMIAIQMETSHVRLYENSWTYAEVMAYFMDMGWEPVFVDRGFTDSRTS